MRRLLCTPLLIRLLASPFVTVGESGERYTSEPPRARKACIVDYVAPHILVGSIEVNRAKEHLVQSA
jgi:hypothetical protein